MLVTTLTKKMAEDLTAYLETMGIKVRYMHHDVKTIERQELVRDLRLGVYDVLVGINLLREGLDIPEVSLVCHSRCGQGGISPVGDLAHQTIGRAARNEHGMVRAVCRQHHALDEARDGRDRAPPCAAGCV